ncbi:MAG: hypothetical protein H7A45_00895 [Verrucomicrobiales bacterium]|nr:hypothetical protein [Verrucomicrobiales bacterium]
MNRFFRWLRWSVLMVLLPLRAEEVDVYLLGGQSNMQGIAKVADLPAGFPSAFARVRFWNGKAFEPLTPGRTRTSTREGEFGPELGFAFGLGESGRPVHLIKDHASGMPLHHGWNGNRWEGGEPAPGRRNFHPGGSPDDANTGLLYRAMIVRFRAGLEFLRSEGHTPVVRGFLWMQGEQDSKEAVSAGEYAASLKQLRRRVAEDVGATPDLPFAFGQVLPHEPALERFTHRAEIRDQMAAADEHSGRPEAMRHARMISTDGFGLLPDLVHYDADGQFRLGRAFAQAMRELQDRR